jgi:branched-subunit amino acid aminotransferase/4-amino-4-deoxychorismate lyase
VADPPPESTLVIEARPLHPYPPEMYQTGVTVIVSSSVHDSHSGIRRHKTLNYLPSILAKREAAERGADEAILLDSAGYVAEGATSNVFCVREGTLVTPPLDMDILPGVTRATVIRLARDAGLEVVEARFTPAELQSAAEGFLTNSLMELMPVRALEGSPLPACPGAVTSDLAKGYSDLASAADRLRP